MKRDHRLRDELRRDLDEAAQPEQDHAAQQRNTAIAVAALALLVIALLVFIVMGGTGAYL